MAIVIVTGSGGLIGSECVRFYCEKKYDVIGIDNDMRQHLFGKEATTAPVIAILKNSYSNYRHFQNDIRDFCQIENIISKFQHDIKLIIHTAAQPSHDWATQDTFTDFSINANGTLNLLEAYHRHAPHAVFIYTSTNKVYGDHPNQLPLIEEEFRYTIDKSHPFTSGVDESMSIDQSLHSLFGVSKTAGDLLTQEYGRYYHLKTAVFRGGCLTGPWHAGTHLHGFLSYLVKSAVHNKEYTILGYKGKQVRDNIHSSDFVTAIDAFFKNPHSGVVYNMGGGVYSNCSILEAINFLEKLKGKKILTTYCEKARIGDHIWYISDLRRFEKDYPNWKIRHSIEDILREMYDFESRQRFAA